MRGYLQKRRVRLSDSASILFENAITVRHQVHEVLYWETSDDAAAEARVREELETYRPLLPSSHRLTATLFIDGGSADRGFALGQALSSGRSRIGICINGSVVAARLAEADPDQSEPVKFLSFDLTQDQRRAFLTGGVHAVRIADGRAFSLQGLPTQTVMSLLQDIQRPGRQGTQPHGPVAGATGERRTATPDRSQAPDARVGQFRPSFGVT
jgi:hypothetical protein